LCTARHGETIVFLINIAHGALGTGRLRGVRVEAPASFPGAGRANGVVLARFQEPDGGARPDHPATRGHRTRRPGPVSPLVYPLVPRLNSTRQRARHRAVWMPRDIF
jgi:hypothetical protein